MLPPIQSHPWHNRRHHQANWFDNPDGPARRISPGKMLAWIVKKSLRRKTNTPPPVHLLAPEQLHTAPASTRLTWLGHACLLIQTPQWTLLTDPMLGRRASPLSFAGPERFPDLPLPVDALPPIDFVLISHDHYDHLDRQSIERLAADHEPLFLAPLGVADRLYDWNVHRVVEADWWQYVEIDGWRLHCTPAQHFSGRTLFDRNTTLWCSWYVEPMDAAGSTMYFAGDTAYTDHFTTLRERLGAPRIAILPIGAYRPRWFMEAVHVDPGQAVRAFLDLRAQHFIPMHWGTFDLADEPIDEPARELQTYAATHQVDDQVHILDIGAPVEIDDPPAP